MAETSSWNYKTNGPHQNGLLEVLFCFPRRVCSKLCYNNTPTPTQKKHWNDSPWYNCSGWLGVRHQFTYCHNWYASLCALFPVPHPHCRVLGQSCCCVPVSVRRQGQLFWDWQCVVISLCSRLDGVAYIRYVHCSVHCFGGMHCPRFGTSTTNVRVAEVRSLLVWGKHPNIVLRLPSVSTHSFCQRSFSYAAQSVWNSLPCKTRSSNTLTSFKSHLFKLHNWLCVCARARVCMCVSLFWLCFGSLLHYGLCAPRLEK